MNTYTFDQIEIGMKESFAVKITDEMMKNFCQMTGDVNPLHQDAAFANEKGYESCVVYGMLSASFLSTFAGVYLPGSNSLIHSVETKFVKPVFVGDTLRVQGSVSEKNDTFRFITIKATISNQDGEKVIRAKMQVGFSS